MIPSHPGFAASPESRTPFLLHAAYPGFSAALLESIAEKTVPEPAKSPELDALLLSLREGRTPVLGTEAMEPLAGAVLVRAAGDPVEALALDEFLASLGAGAPKEGGGLSLAMPRRDSRFLSGPDEGQDVSQWLASGFDGTLGRNGTVGLPVGTGGSGFRGAAYSIDLASKDSAAGTRPAKEDDSVFLKLYSISAEEARKLGDKARSAIDKELHKERSLLKLKESFGISDGAAIGGAGVFKTKILTEEEVSADPVRRQVRERARERGEEIVFLKTNTKVQLFGSAAIPIDLPVGPATPSIGLRLSGFVEVIRTRAVPKDKAKVWQNLKQRVFMWPMTVEKLREDMRVGEGLTITGRVDRGSALALGLGERLGTTRFGSVGVGVQGSVGRAKDVWVSLHLNKISGDEVRVVIQKGNGEVLSSNIRLTAGLDIYDDTFIPEVSPQGLEDSTLGALVTKGEVKLLNKLEKLAQAEISGSWSKGKHDSETEGWGRVSLSDPKSAEALEKLFKFDPEKIRRLSPEETRSEIVDAGHLNARVRDITEDKQFQMRLILLRLTKASGTRFYEVQWAKDNGLVEHYLVGVAMSRFRGKVTDTQRNVETVMWHDLSTGKSRVTVRLGPQDRLMTTTREKINDVIAVQKALGVPVRGEIDHPGVYLKFFGLGNYGRTRELGYYTLEPAGVERVGAAGEDELLTSYLKADWLFEKESYPPGYIWAMHSKAPPWAESGAAELAPVLAFLKKNARKAMHEDSPGKKHGNRNSGLKRAYRELAPGRSLRSDAWNFVAAQAFARHVLAMGDSGENPEKLVEMFLLLRKDDMVELKRSVVAVSLLAGSGSYSAYLEMTGKNVTLVPVDGAPVLPDHPITVLNRLIEDWKK